jgi:CheY-like chemotaxis protein
MADANTVHLVLEPFTVAQAAYPEALFFDGDADRILQVVTNLLSNAIKFSPVASTVRVHTEATSDSILLKVVDEGRGIPTDKLDSIFDRFQQIEPSDARQKGGTGLGLAICRSIVQQHSGSIWAQRNLGLGSTLYVMLPRTSRATDVMLPSSLPPRGEGAILVCDDEPASAPCLRAPPARATRHRSFSANRPRPRRRAHVEAILLDLYMPGLSGWETLQRSATIPSRQTSPSLSSAFSPPPCAPSSPATPRAGCRNLQRKPPLRRTRPRPPSRRGPYVLLVRRRRRLASVLTASFRMQRYD